MKDRDREKQKEMEKKLDSLDLDAVGRAAARMNDGSSSGSTFVDRREQKELDSFVEAMSYLLGN